MFYGSNISEFFRGLFHHDSKALKAGESYVLCVDYDGPGSVGFANAYDGVPGHRQKTDRVRVRVDICFFGAGMVRIIDICTNTHTGLEKWCCCS